MSTNIRFLDKSRDEDEPADWETLHSISGAFLEPECYAFAIALSRALGWPIIGLMRGVIVWHALLKSPDGIVDYRGTPFKQDDPELGRPFDMDPPYQLTVVYESDLLKIRPVLDHDIRVARTIAEALWPEYPWDNPVYRRMIAFANDLETLCRNHGIWLRAPYPGQRSILYVEDEDKGEDGYDLQIMMDGKQCMIDRRLK